MTGAGMRHSTPIIPATSWNEELLEVISEDLGPEYDDFADKAREMLDSKIASLHEVIDDFSFLGSYPDQDPQPQKLIVQLAHVPGSEDRQLRLFRESLDLKQSEITRMFESVYDRLKYDFIRYVNRSLLDPIPYCC